MYKRDDPNDFDVLGLAKVVFEDIYISIYDIDGKEAADELRTGLTASSDKIETARSKHARYASGDALKYSIQSDVLVGVDKSQLLGSNRRNIHKKKPSFAGVDMWGSSEAFDLTQIMEEESVPGSPKKKREFHPLRDSRPPKDIY